MTRGLVV